MLMLPSCVAGLAAVSGVVPRQRQIVSSGLSELETMTVVDVLRRARGVEYEAVITSERICGLEERRFVLIPEVELVDDVVEALDSLRIGGDAALGIGGGPVLVLDGEGCADSAAERYLERHDMIREVRTHQTEWNVRESRVSCHIEIDGEFRDDFDGRFDASEIVVLDGLVDEDLRASLLDCLGGDPINEKWWKKGSGFADVAGRKNNKGWGLRPDRLEAISSDKHPPPPLVELQSRLTAYFQHCCPSSSVRVCRIPSKACFGLDSPVPAVVANAPVAADAGQYRYHVDADPFLLPPSPFTDFFGHYVNRTPRRPRWVSALVYLSPDWPTDFGAPTRFIDPPTKQVVDVLPKPGRLVLLDQDISHCVVAPEKAARDRPRFSLVLKLLLYADHPLSPKLKPTPSQHDPSARRDPVPSPPLGKMPQVQDPTESARGDDGEKKENKAHSLSGGGDLVSLAPPVPFDDTRPLWQQDTPSPIRIGSAAKDPALQDILPPHQATHNRVYTVR